MNQASTSDVPVDRKLGESPRRISDIPRLGHIDPAAEAIRHARQDLDVCGAGAGGRRGRGEPRRRGRSRGRPRARRRREQSGVARAAVRCHATGCVGGDRQRAVVRPRDRPHRCALRTEAQPIYGGRLSGRRVPRCAAGRRRAIGDPRHGERADDAAQRSMPCGAGSCRSGAAGRGAHLYVGYDRRSEGCDAHAPQPAVYRASVQRPPQLAP